MTKQVFEVILLDDGELPPARATNPGEPTAAESKTRHTFLIQEHQTLVRHFEEIYRTSATGFSVAVAGTGALLAYFGPNWQSGQIAMAVLPLAAWYLGVVLASYRYTKSVRNRLAKIETELKIVGHFKNWVDDQSNRTFGADAPIHIIMVVLIAMAIAFPFALMYLHDGTRTPVEVVIEQKDGKPGVQVKFASLPNEASLKFWRDMVRMLEEPRPRTNPTK